MLPSPAKHRIPVYSTIGHEDDAEMIEAHELRKEFITKKGTPFKRQNEIVRAVDGISFSIQQREIFSLLGPNGAGKTTAI